MNQKNVQTKLAIEKQCILNDLAASKSTRNINTT